MHSLCGGMFQLVCLKGDNAPTPIEKIINRLFCKKYISASSFANSKNTHKIKNIPLKQNNSYLGLNTNCPFHAGTDQGFPVGGGANPPGKAAIYKFWKEIDEIKKMFLRRGRVHGMSLLDLPMPWPIW